MENLGWVKFHREWKESRVFQDPVLWKLFSWCLFRANYTTIDNPFNGKENALQAGQFLTGRYSGARECNMKDSSFWNRLKRLEKLGFISINSNNKNSVVTVLNWQSLQTDDPTLAASLATDYQQSNTDKNERKKKYSAKIRSKNQKGFNLERIPATQQMLEAEDE